MQKIKDFLIQNNIKDRSFVVGVSGGADSLALVLLFKEECPDYNIIALTVDHQLRPSSRREAEYVSKIMQEHHIEHHILTWVGNKPETGIEEKAREERYKLLTTWCKNNNIHNLLVAHHLLDQAETFLMRLERGSGLFGLSCMESIVEHHGISILRPLLNVHPDELKLYLKNKHIEWIEDESNQCLDLLRVRVRKFLPILERELNISPENLYLAADNLQKTKNFIKDTIFNIIEKDAHNWDNFAYSLDYYKFMSFHDELKYYLLCELISKTGNLVYYPESKSVLELIDSLKRESFRKTTLGNCLILKSDMRLWIILEKREKKLFYHDSEWNNYLIENSSFRGITIPYELKILLINEKK